MNEIQSCTLAIALSMVGSAVIIIWIIDDAARSIVAAVRDSIAEKR